MNGIEQAPTINESQSGLLVGGLRNGTNSVVINVAQAGKGTASTPEVTIRRILESRKTAEVFKFSPKEKIEGKYTFDLIIDK